MLKTWRLVLGGLVASGVVVAGLVAQSSGSSEEPIVLDQQAFFQAHVEVLAPKTPADHFSARTLRGLLSFGNRFEPQPVPADVPFTRAEVLASIDSGRKAPSEVVYGLLTTEDMEKRVRSSDGTEKIVPRLDHRAVWIVMTRDVPTMPMGGPLVRGSAKPVKPQISYAARSWFAYSAKTGKALMGETG